MGRPATDKRKRLVSAAAERFHRAGSARTSLAEVAAQAGVPPGNVFYYFRTKDDLAKAVVDDWCVSLQEHLRALERDPDPLGRVRLLVDQVESLVDMYVRWGCPFAGLARDLRQVGGTLMEEAPRTYVIQREWIDCQFRLAGADASHADAYARFVLSAIHGSILLAHAAGDPAFIRTGRVQLTAWLDGIRLKLPPTTL